MLLYPAIDIKNGQCVRLLQGRAQDATIYGDDPVAMARRWAELGARRLHVVDLDGAFTGQGQNLQAVASICKALPHVAVQLGGGIRTIADIQARLDFGVSRVILGTILIDNPDFAQEAILRFGPEHLVAGIDAKDGIAATRGWVEASGLPAVELGKQLYAAGFRHCVYTDIARDGMLTGPNIPRTKEMLEQTGLSIIASGGMSCLEDLAACHALGCSGAILGKALYDGRIDLAESIRQYG